MAEQNLSSLDFCILVSKAERQHEQLAYDVEKLAERMANLAYARGYYRALDHLESFLYNQIPDETLQKALRRALELGPKLEGA